MAVKGKGKQIASDAPGPSSSGAKRRGGGAGTSSSSAAKRRRGVLQYVDDAAGVDDEYEEDEDEDEEEEEEEGQEEDLDDGFFTAGRTKGAAVNKRVERSHPLPFLGHVKEEELSGDELEEFINQRYSNRVRYAGYGGSTEQYDDDEEFSMDGVKDPIIWRVKCMVGRERQMAFCFMQKFLDLKKFGTKVPIISAFSLDHVRGFVFVEAEKACDVTEACKGFCNVYVNRTSPVPVAEVPSLLATRAKLFEVSPGTWVRMKSGNYKGDLAQVAGADDGRKRVLIKLIPRVDLHAISKKFGGAISLKDAGVPAPRLISSQELEYFGPHIERRRDRQTGDVFEVLDGLMFKDGFLYKRVAISSLIYWSIQPTDTEILKFSSSPSIKNSADDMDWVSGIYGHNNKKRNVPREQDMNTPTSSKGKSSKASLKGSTSTENYDDDGDGEDAGFNLHDLVLFGRKDFGVIIAVEKDGYKILKGGPEGSAVTVRKQDIKKAIVDKMFTAVDHQKKLISMHDTVKVLEGPVQGKQGVVKHLYMGILFIYDEGESENNGFFCAQCGSCENIKKKRDLANSEDNPIPMFSESAFTSSEQNEQRNNERPYRAPREQLFQVGEMLRIRKGPLKGYLCRVVRIFRNDVTVKLDSLLKIVTVQAEFLSVPVKRGDNSSSAPSGNFGTQDTPFSEATKTSWDNGFASLGSDSWQPFSSSALPAQNTGGDTDADPWCKKPTADSDSDPWGNKASAAVDVWNNITTEKESSTDNGWDKQAGGGGLDAGGSSWGGGAVNMDSEKSGNWGDAGKQVDMAAGGDTDPWGSKVKEVATEEADPWGSKVKEVATKEADPWGSKVKEVATEEADPWGSKVKEVATEEADPWGNKVKEVATEEADPWGSKVKEVPTKEADPWGSKSSGPTGGDGQGWGQSFGKSNQDREKGAVPKDADNSGSWDTAKSDTLPVAQEDAWGKSKDSNNDRAVEWNKAGTSSQNCGSGGWDTVVVGQGQDEAWGEQKDSGAKSEETNNGSGNWNKAGSSDQVGGSDWDKPKFSGGAGSSSWNKGEAADGDNQNSTWSRPAGNFEGGRGFGQGRGRGRGRESRDSGDNNNQESWKGSWGNDSSAKPSWGSDTQVSNEGGDSGGYRGRGRGRGQYGGRGGGRDNGWRNGDRGSSEFGRERSCSDAPKWGSSQPWSANEGTKPCDENQTPTWNSSEDKKLSGGEQDDPWGSKIAAKGQEQTDAWSSKLTSTAGADNNDGWNTKAKESSCNTGAKWENAASGEEQQGKEQETDPWASKVSSVAAEEKADPWNTKGGNGNDGGWNSAGSSSWSKPSSSSGDQEPAWNKPKYGDDNAGYGGGGFVRGNRGRGRGRFGDSGSSWNGGSNTNDESGGERSDGGRGRGRGRFGRGDRNQGNNFGSGDGDGGSWGSGRGNRGGRGGGYRNYGNDNNEGRASSQDRGGGGWSHSSAWNADKKGSAAAEEDQGFSKGKSSWGSGKNDSWGAPKPFGGDDQAGKKDGNNTWSQNKPSSGDGSSILDQWAPAGGTTSGGGASGNGSSILGQWGAPAGDTMVGTGGSVGGGGSWGKSNEDSWNSPKGTEGSGGSKKEGSWDKAEGSGSQGGGSSSSWDKAGGDGWDSNKGGDTSNGGGSGW